MPNQKISALPNAAALGNADVLPCVSGAATKKVTRALVLTALAGENIVLQGVAGQLSMIQAAGIASQFAAAANGNSTIGYSLNFQVNLGGFGVVMGADNVGNLQFNIGNAGGTAVIGRAGSTLVTINDGAQVITLFAALGVAISYVPANPGDWVVPPTDLALAVDRIARVVSAGGTVPIP